MRTMKRFITFLTAAAAAISMTSCMKKDVEVEHKVSQPPKLVFMGDSIAAGYGLEGYTSTDNYNCQSYSNILKDKYTDELKDSCGHEMLNVAVSGDTSAELLEHIDNGEFDKDLKGSDAVVISIGGNDILEIFTEFLSENFDSDTGIMGLFSAIDSIGSIGDDVDAALDNFEPNLKQIVMDIRKRTNGEIFIQTLYNPLEYFDKLSFLVDFSNEKIGKLNDIIKENSETNGIPQYTVIDVAPAFKGKCGELTTIKNFDIHPNAEGHKVIADVVDESLQSKKYSYTVIEKQTDVKAVVMLTVACCAAAAVIITTSVVIYKKRKSRK